MKNMWVIRAGKDTKNFNLYKKENFVAVGEDIGDIKNLSLEEIKFRLKGKANNVNTSAGVIRRFRDEVKIGDYFISTSPNSEYLLLGEILGDILYNPNLSQRYQYTCYRRPVKWISKIYRNDLSDDAKRGISPQTTVFKVNPKWQIEIFKNQLAIDFTPNDNINSNKDSIDSADSNSKKKGKTSIAKSLGIENEFSHIISIRDEYEIALGKPINIYAYDESLSESENINRKYYLKRSAKLLERHKLYDDLINLYKIYTKNSYFENDWYPYRQLNITYKKTKDYEAALENIKDLFLSGIWLNDYQYTWFTNKIRLLKKHIDIDEEQVQSWLDFYDLNGAKNKDKLNYPTFLADRMTLDNKKINVKSEEAFDLTQKIYYFEETGRILENKGKYEMAINFYQKKIDYYPLFVFYQRICYCLEKLEDYESELGCIKEYYQNPPKDASYESESWFKNRLKKVNDKLGTDYTVEDLK